MYISKETPLISTILCFWFLLSNSASCIALEKNVSSDYAALMAFKSKFTPEPDSNILSTSWSSKTHYCTWFGVTCFNNRVTNLVLLGRKMPGELSPQIANLTHLEELDLTGNEIRGTVPRELGSLQRLRSLRLAFNNLQGTIPQELGNLGNLRHFDFHGNSLRGSIPEQLGNLGNLKMLDLGINNLTGSIPPSLFSISTLQYLDLSENTFSGQLPDNLGDEMPNLETLYFQTNRITGRIPKSLSNATMLGYLNLGNNDLHGEIPNEFSSLSNLYWFEFGMNRISGRIPSGLFNITSLVILDASNNNLKGNLLPDIGNRLPNLQRIYLTGNQFTGPLPSSICNATKLNILDVSVNSFSGPIPMMLGNLVNLWSLYLDENLLTINPTSTHLDFLKSMANIPDLRYLHFSFNPLNGEIPESISNMSVKLVFAAINCGLKGRIPHGFGNLSSLNRLYLSANDLQGSVPSSLEGMQNLEGIYLSENKLEGSLPTAFCSIPIMGFLYLDGNDFSGSIPACLQNLTKMSKINLADNKLNSTIPLGIWSLENVLELNFSGNLLYGSIPVEVENLKAITIFDLSSNNFSGVIPASIGSLQNIQKLDMSRNNFQGPIPNGFSNLIVIDYLDLSSNNLSGEIPSSLGSLQTLQFLNLSFNMLRGEIPNTGVFANITFQSLMGNPNLCGAPSLSFPLCSHQSSQRRKRRTSPVLQITIPIVAICLLLFAMVLLWMKFSQGKPKAAEIQLENSLVEHRMITYHELMRATESFSMVNLLGEGSSGKVYKGELLDGTIAAIKVFNMQYMKALRSFDAECEVLRNVRHRNLVKIISTCTNLEFKAMIIEFMSNGSLDKRLHSESSSLSLAERLDIVIDVALGMAYLHHEYEVPIVHCDLKPANILLNEDMTAHISDFGISKILAQDQEFVQTNTIGTIGYMAPESGLDGHASTNGDVYSFGILLLETFTGKRPTDDMFTDGFSLHQWVYQSFPDALVQVLDSRLFADINSSGEGSSAPINRIQQHTEDILVSIIQVALLCLKELPDERIDMKTVAAHLKKIRAELKKKNANTASRSTHDSST